MKNKKQKNINFKDITERFNEIKKLYKEKNYYKNMDYLINRKIDLQTKLNINIQENKIFDRILPGLTVIIPLFIDRIIDCFSMLTKKANNPLIDMFSFIIALVIFVIIIYINLKFEKSKIDYKKVTLYELELDLVNKYITHLINLNE